MTSTLEERIKITNLRVMKPKKIITPKQIKKEISINEKLKKFIQKSRETIQDILDKKDPRLMIITGPCSIHDYDSALEYAKKLKNLSEKVDDKIYLVMRTYFQKPRTAKGWKGFIYDPDLNDSYDIEKGILNSRKLLKKITELNIPCGTEFLDTLMPQYIDDLISWSSIGARTTESQTHREIASGLSMPVGFKNNTKGDIQSAVNSVKSATNPHKFIGATEKGEYAIFPTTGNPYSHVILRGGINPNYDENSINQAITLLKKENLPERIIIDCSHGNSKKDYKKQSFVFENLIQQKKQNPKIIGVMLESNLFEGNQPISENLKYGVSITDSCINWKTTEKLINQAYKQLSF